MLARTTVERSLGVLREARKAGCGERAGGRCRGRWGEVHTPGQDLMLESGGGGVRGGDHMAWGSAIGRSLCLAIRRVGQLGRGSPEAIPATDGKLGVREAPPHLPPLPPCRALLHMAACAEPQDHWSAPEPPGAWQTLSRGKGLGPEKSRVTFGPAGRMSAGRRPTQASSCSEHLRLGATGWHPELQAPGTGSSGLWVQTCIQRPFPTPLTPTTQEPGPKESPSSHVRRVTGLPVT